MRHNITSIIVTLGLTLVSSCVAEAPKEGSCSRKCSPRQIGGGTNLNVVTLGPGVTFKNCQAGSELQQQKYQFYVYEDMRETNANGSTGTEGSGVPFPDRIGKANIAVVPTGLGDETDSWARLDTPTDELCTDSCGYVDIHFTPKCYQQEISIGLIVPGADYSEGVPTIPFKVVFDQ